MLDLFHSRDNPDGTSHDGFTANVIETTTRCPGRLGAASRPQAADAGHPNPEGTRRPSDGACRGKPLSLTCRSSRGSSRAHSWGASRRMRRRWRLSGAGRSARRPVQLIVQSAGMLSVAVSRSLVLLAEIENPQPAYASMAAVKLLAGASKLKWSSSLKKMGLACSPAPRVSDAPAPRCDSGRRHRCHAAEENQQRVRHFPKALDCHRKRCSRAGDGRWSPPHSPARARSVRELARASGWSGRRRRRTRC